MKRILIIITMSIWDMCSIYAQHTHEIEPAILECHYEHIKVVDTVTFRNLGKDIMILRIGKDVSQFFSYYTFNGDSLWNDPKGKKIIEKSTLDAIRKRKFSEIPGARTTSEYIYKNYPKGEFSTYGLVSPNDYYVIKEDTPTFQWIITDSTKTVCGYACQLATTDFRGRSYKAWFTPEIPISDGPWKLSGLPGLILEAYDTQNHYHYTLIGIKQSDLKPVEFYNYWERKYEKIERIKYLKAQYKSHNDTHPMRTIKAKTGIDLGEDSPSRERPKVAFDFLERDYR